MSKNDVGEGGCGETKPRSPYEKPRVQREELAIDETLSTGCKATVEDCIATNAMFDMGS